MAPSGAAVPRRGGGGGGGVGRGGVLHPRRVPIPPQHNRLGGAGLARLPFTQKHPRTPSIGPPAGDEMICSSPGAQHRTREDAACSPRGFAKKKKKKPRGGHGHDSADACHAGPRAHAAEHTAERRARELSDALAAPRAGGAVESVHGEHRRGAAPAPLVRALTMCDRPGRRQRLGASSRSPSPRSPPVGSGSRERRRAPRAVSEYS
jgi:hypothetical protein